MLTQDTETVQPGGPGTVTRTVVEETVVPAPRRLDPALTRRQLAIMPRALPVEPAVVVPPGAKVETTETKTIVKRPGLPPRVYNVERSVVVIEGHTSTDGEAEMNLDLSARRARRVHGELTANYAVPPEVLTAHGHGENYPAYPDGTEEQMVLDRRVLVVRVK